MPEDTSQSTQNEGTPTSVMLHIDTSGKERDVSFLSTSSTANNGLHPFAYSIELEEQASLLAAAGIAVSATANSTTPVSTIHESYAYRPWERSLLSTPREIGTNKCAEQKEARQETQVIRQRPKIKHKRTRKNYEPDIYMFVEYTDRDVLCQRGGLANDHPGNGKYLRARDELQLSYTKAGKAEKTAISQRLVDQVHNWNGRFLRKDKLSQKWYKIHNQTARTKAGQALREEYTTEQRAAKRLKYSQS